jgi:hypothetical protein
MIFLDRFESAIKIPKNINLTPLSGTFRVTFYGRRSAAHRVRCVPKNTNYALRAVRPQAADRPVGGWPPAGRIVMTP